MSSRSAKNRYVDVVLPVPVERVFTYRVPDGIPSPAPGSRVLVPFGRRRATGYVIASRKTVPRGIRVKPVATVIDETPLIDESLLSLARLIAERYVHPLGEVLRAMLPASLKGKGRKTGDEADGFPHDVEYPELTGEQRAAVAAVTGALERGGGQRFLLHGVTGSGKTEVYLRCIEEALARGRSALVLIPEIALIPQTTARFRRRFGDAVAVLHSRLTGPRRHSIWRRAAAGDARVVIGARSAVFTPMPELGIVVVDEEQDTSFKQEEKPHYHAVAVAAMRARLQDAVLLLGSATPSLESYDDAVATGETALLPLSTRPLGGRMPDVEVVDMRGEKDLVSGRLLDELDRCRREGEQAIVLLNRRGHAHFVQCRACGWIERCPHCSITLTYHSRSGELRCHYCGHRHPLPEQCPGCGKWGLRQQGAGTQRIENDLSNLVPGLRVLRMDVDTTAGVDGHLRILERFSRGEADVLLGTQMVAKGHHFPAVSLVGVLSGDAGLNFPDFRAVERSFQLLFQAAGRTGRGGGVGRVIVQTLVPDHYLYEHLARHDFAGFARRELELRGELGYPPAGRLVLFTVSARSEEAALADADRVVDALRDAAGMLASVLGPAPALVQRLRGRHRFRVLVRGPLDAADCRRFVDAARAALGKRPGVELSWDVDPVNIS